MPEKRPKRKKPYTKPEAMRFEGGEVFPKGEVPRDRARLGSKVRSAADRKFVEDCIGSQEAGKVLKKIDSLASEGLKLSDGLRHNYGIYDPKSKIVIGTNQVIRAAQMSSLLCNELLKREIRGEKLASAALNLMRMVNLLDARFPAYAETLRHQAEEAKEKSRE